MCGISGIYQFNNTIASSADIEKLTTAIAHRGPDGQGIWVAPNGKIALGHRRLAILDLSEAGAQPMADQTGRYQIVFNGEIFNFIEIRETLKTVGYQFFTETDTEVVLAAYQHWGKAMLHQFNGMWAFAIYDTQTQDLFFARDRFGVKPLYYYADENRLMWASEVQAIHQLLGKAHPLCAESLRNTALGGFDTYGSSKTYLQGVYNLPASHCMTVIDGKIQTEQWYHLRQIKVPGKLKDQAKVLRTLLFDACRIRLRSDVPVATCLSGGLDSGSITAAIKAIDNEQKRTDRYAENYAHTGFCATFEGTPLDESAAAKQLAQTLQTNVNLLPIDAPTPEELEQSMLSCDGSMHALAFFPIWKLYKHIREQGIKVTLDGQGPDEMLGGYRPVAEALETALSLKDWFWFEEILDAYQHQGETTQMSSRRMVEQARKMVVQKHFQEIIRWPRQRAGMVLRKIGVLKPYFPPVDSNGLKMAVPVPIFIQTNIDQSLFKQFFFNPLPCILQQYERCSMAHGVECRMPFMDYRIVEFIFSLPPQSKIGKGYNKLVLREAMEGILPDFIRLNRTKIGFNAPIVDWFKGSLREWMVGQIMQPSFTENPYFDGVAVRKKFLDFLEKDSDSWEDAWAFWPAVHLNWWLSRNTNS